MTAFFSPYILFILLFSYCFLPKISYAQVQQSNAADPSDILFSIEKANDSDQPSTGTIFRASAQLGILSLTGDTRSDDIKAGFDIHFERGLWRSTFGGDLLIKKTEKTTVSSSGVAIKELSTSDHRWSLASQTNYTINPLNKNYVYGSLFYDEDRFSSFKSQSSMSIGWGRRWHENKQSNFDADIGPGYKQDITLVTPAEIALGQTSEKLNSLILQIQALYRNKLNEHIEFKQLLVVKHAIATGENSIYKSGSSITSRLIDSLQLKLNFVANYNSQVDNDKENLNTETSVVLVYSF
ncbi:DUF481 domain-containing protein [Colwellia sp. E2M01]|uniref:DUF481 domain-containing protein n=1 Tax=Colwellia sp. E2M01 TaxID=2841561 RepID=UPI001C089CFE|nr:DUF481 domain-containing protein [Colwellia sp. E2M01]MBU2872266.1 DUF481 domain-containing protein [Colwellia sp. E2M01]